MFGTARRSARHVLALAFAIVLVGGLAPWVERLGAAEVCSARGHGASHVVEQGGPSSSHDHAAHCPLCMPCGAPPATFAWVAPSGQRVAALVERPSSAPLAARAGAPFPPRAPPVLA